MIVYMFDDVNSNTNINNNIDLQKKRFKLTFSNISSSQYDS